MGDRIKCTVFFLPFRVQHLSFITIGDLLSSPVIQTGNTPDSNSEAFSPKQSPPRQQQPSSSRRILTLPEQEQRWHPMPPAPKTSNRNTASDTMICDIIFISQITPPPK
ncbi:MAG: hypothetical protein IK126_00530 [Bacteroidales bacterium]|nr:hypothetical protein [Bacteroidales bacterium]